MLRRYWLITAIFYGLTLANCGRVAFAQCFGCGSGGGGSSAFSAITSGTNVSAAMVCSTGCSLGVSGSGTIAATSVGGFTPGAGTLTGPATNGTVSATSGANVVPQAGAGGTIANAFIGTLNQNTTGTAANLSGTPALPNGTTATTQSQADGSTKLATTAYVDTGLSGKAPAVSFVAGAGALTGPATSGTVSPTAGANVIPQAGSGGTIANGFIGTLNQNTTGTAANLSGTPALPNGTTATTQSQADGSTKLATTSYVDTGLSGKASSSASITVNSTTCTLGSSCSPPGAGFTAGAGTLTGPATSGTVSPTAAANAIPQAGSGGTISPAFLPGYALGAQQLGSVLMTSTTACTTASSNGVSASCAAGSVTFSSLPSSGFSGVLLASVARSSDAAHTDSVYLQFNGDTGSNYSQNYVAGASSGSASTGLTTSGAQNFQIGAIPGSTSLANAPAISWLVIPGYAGTTFGKMGFNSGGAIQNTTVSALQVSMSANYWASTSAISSILIQLVSGDDFATGSMFVLYGLN